MSHHNISARESFIVFESALQKTDARDKFSKLVQCTLKLLVWSGRISWVAVAKRVVSELAICRTLIRLGKCWYAWAPTMKKWGTWSQRDLAIRLTHNVGSTLADGIPDLTWLLRVTGAWDGVALATQKRLKKLSHIGAFVTHVINMYLSSKALAERDANLATAVAAAKRRTGESDARSIVEEEATQQLVARINILKVACDLFGATNNTFELGVAPHIMLMLGWTGAFSAVVKHWIKCREAMEEYAGSSYWDKRYAESDATSFDWYFPFAELKEMLPAHVLPEDKTLEIFVPGCGTSDTGEELSKLGYLNVTCVDSSSIAIGQMKKRSARLSSNVDYCFMNVAHLTPVLSEACFDFIFSKALLDAAMCEATAIELVPQILRELHNVLRPGGTFVSISHALPRDRLQLLRKTSLTWSVAEPTPIAKPMVPGMNEMGADRNYYAYVCTKL